MSGENQAPRTSFNFIDWSKNHLRTSYDELKDPNNVSILNCFPFIGRGIEVVQGIRANYSTETKDIMANLQAYNHKKALTCAIIRVATTIAIAVFFGSSSIFFFALFDITTVINCYIYYNKFSEAIPAEKNPPPYQASGAEAPAGC